MWIASLVLFGVAALGGLVMAVQRFRGSPQPSLAIALVHGLLAATGLVLLIIAVVASAGPAPTKAALVLFILAAAGGFYLLANHLRKRALPIPVVIVHALVAVAGFIVLLVAVAGR